MLHCSAHQYNLSDMSICVIAPKRMGYHFWCISRFLDQGLWLQNFDNNSFCVITNWLHVTKKNVSIREWIHSLYKSLFFNTGNSVFDKLECSTFTSAVSSCKNKIKIGSPEFHYMQDLPYFVELILDHRNWPWIWKHNEQACYFWYFSVCSYSSSSVRN
jgi:hypothetical protein